MTAVVDGRNGAEAVPPTNSLFPLIDLLAPLPGHAIVRYAVVALLTYVVFLGLALAEGALARVLNSFMHIQEISITIAIFAGLAFARSTSVNFDQTMSVCGHYFKLNPDSYKAIVSNARQKVRKWYAIILTLPFSALSVACFWALSMNFPDAMYPVTRYSAAYVYMVFIQYSMLSLYLLAGMGFWFLLVMNTTFRRLDACELQDSALRAGSRLYELPGLMFQAAMFVFIGMSIVLPPLVYIIVERDSVVVQVGGIVSVAGAYIMLLSLAGMSQYSIHRLIVRAKYRRLDEIQDRFDAIQKRIESFPEGFSAGAAGFEEMDRLIKLNTYLRECFDDTDRLIKEWPFDLRSLGQLVASGLIPIVSLITMVRSLFSK